MNILRWILVLPISIICSIIFPYLYQIIIEFIIDKETFAGSFFLNGTNFFLQGIFFIVPAYLIVPKFKIQTLKLLLVIWVLFIFFGESYLYNKNLENTGVWNSILRVIGALLAYFNIILKHKEETINTNAKILQEKEIILAEEERIATINRIIEKSLKNPAAKKFLEIKLLKKKAEIEKERNINKK